MVNCKCKYLGTHCLGSAVLRDVTRLVWEFVHGYVSCFECLGFVIAAEGGSIAAFAVRKTVGAGLLALAGAAVLGGTGAGPASWVASASAAVLVPDPVFSGTLTTQQQTEMMQWGQLYFNRVEGIG